MSRLDFYHAYHARLFAPLLGMMLRGVRLDADVRAAAYAAARAKADAARVRCNDIAGMSVFGPKAVSRTKLASYLYEHLRLPKQYVTEGASKKVTTRAVAIRRLELRFPEKLGDFGLAVREFVRADKLSQFLVPTKADADGRIRCTYKLTDTCRLASHANPKGTGTNLQNIDREARDGFVPEPGHVWLKLDLAQIENRLFAMHTGSARLIERALTPPWEFDEHSANASLIFGRPITKANYIERRIGKEVEHGGERGMGGPTLSDRLMKYGFVYTPEECDAFIAQLHANKPEIRAFHREIRRRILRDHFLRSTHGFVLDFAYERMNEDVFGRGYSFLMQADAGIHLNVAGLIPADRWLVGRRSKLLVQVHDELGFSAHPAEAWDLYDYVRRKLEAPWLVNGHEFRAFAEVELGTSWACERKFPRPPTRAEFEAAIDGLMKEAA